MRLLLALSVLLLAACGGRDAGAGAPAGPGSEVRGPAPAAAAAPGEPAASVAPAAPAPPEPPAAAVDERFADTRGAWRVDYHLRLPAQPATAQRRLRHACTAWLFQGLAQPRASVAESGEAALATLVADGGAEGGASVRTVLATHQGGGWLALCRTDSSSAGGVALNRREGLIVELPEVRALTLDEIVPPERQDELRATLALGIRRTRGLPADGPLTATIASDAELPIPVPLLTAAGALFVWNPYEIAPAADGAYEVELPVAQVRALLAVDPWRE